MAILRIFVESCSDRFFAEEECIGAWNAWKKLNIRARVVEGDPWAVNCAPFRRIDPTERVTKSKTSGPCWLYFEIQFTNGTRVSLSFLPDNFDVKLEERSVAFLFSFLAHYSELNTYIHGNLDSRIWEIQSHKTLLHCRITSSSWGVQAETSAPTENLSNFFNYVKRCRRFRAAKNKTEFYFDDLISKPPSDTFNLLSSECI